uniref:BTB domain-containing protein n=1 Tax=Panagrolaimus davidi TaxID=227884 RepID=A0A914NYD3_9BILA
MKSHDYINELQPQLEAAFKSQDAELLNVVFDIEGKKIYADKLILSIKSSTFKSMLSDRWISKNDSIKVETYKYEDFKELLTFIYSGECNITNENIFAILDMAEFYQIEHLKKLCDEYLSKMELNLSNVLQLIETSNKYSLIQMKGEIETFIFQNFANLAKFDGFLNADKSIIKEMVAMESNFSKYHEKMFQSIYEWSENQAIKKQKLSNDESFNMNDAIKVEMHEFLPNIQFKKMKLTFLKDYVVKITNSNGQTIFGDISGEQNYEIELMKTLNGRESVNDPFFIFWSTNGEIPSTPNPLKKRDGVQWYLVQDVVNGVVSARDYRCHFDDDDSLIAEMFAESDFEVTRKCKIESE